MSLEQTLIAEAERECGARLAAIEEAAGLIAEAETLAATLRHHGIADAKAIGFSNAGTNVTAFVRCWVSIAAADAQSFAHALADADLHVASLMLAANDQVELRIEGLTATVLVPHPVGDHLLCDLLKERAPEAAHG